LFCAVDEGTLRRYADLIVGVGANVQPGQIVFVQAEPRAAPLVRAIAESAYERGARFVDAWYFDPLVKKARLERAAEDTLDFVPPWYADRLFALSEQRCARISLTPIVPPGLLDGVDPARAGRDALPTLAQAFQVINARTTSWTVSPWPGPEWARLVHPGLAEDDAVAALWDQLAFVLRLDAPDPAEAWRGRLRELFEVAQRIDARRFDALRFDGPGTELEIGLLPTSRFAGDSPGMTTVDGVEFAPNIPTEEIAATPDPERVEGVVTATKPLDIAGTVVRGLRVRFENGRAVEIDAEENAATLLARSKIDEGASRLGEVALVDRAGLIGQTGAVFYNTLLDENAASHIALGNGYAVGVGEEDVPRINTSAIHIDFMIGGDDVAVTGVTGDGAEVPVLRDGVWQV
jgi:aminopeptidase